MNWILDAAVALIIAIFIIVFAAKGFAKAFFGLLSGVIAVVVAIALCGPVGEFVSEKWVEPAVSGFVEQALEDSAKDYAEDTYGEQKDSNELTEKDYGNVIDSISGKLESFMSVLGISKESIKELYDQAAASAHGKLEFFASHLAKTVSLGLSKIVSFIVIFIAALIILKLLSLIFGKLFELPVLKQFNTLGGAAVGAIFGIVTVLVLITGFKLMLPNLHAEDGAPIITEQNIKDSYLFEIFYNIKL
ncbi:MAG: CvpA family protein [Clostridia bacterium]|nr:CvpA family protein [Clostridia bacterium]